MQDVVREDLSIAKLGPQRFLLRDPRGTAAFELGSEERLLIGLLDGQHTPKQIAERHRATFGTDLSLRHLEEFIEQLRTHGLLKGSENRILPANGRTRHNRPAPAPLSWRDPGMAVNSFFDLWVLAFGWMLHPLATLPVLALAVLAAAGLFHHGGLLLDEFMAMADGLSFPIVLLMLALKVFCLDLPRNVFQAMACRKFGGRIRAFNLRLLRGVLPYLALDLGDSLSLMSDRGRNTVLAVRLWVQTAIAALAVVGWRMSPGQTPLHDFLMLLSVTSLVGLLIFQLNVLMRMDAYMLLCRALDMPKLYERARAETRAWLGVRRAPEAIATSERHWFRFYGFLTYVWNAALTVLVVGGGMWLIAQRFGGLGALVGAALALRWYWDDVRRWMMASNSFNWIIRAGGKWYVRWPVRLAILAGLVYAAFLPSNYEISGKSRLVPGTQYGVRSQLTDEIVKVNVKEGDLVQVGDVIAVLSGRDENAQVAIVDAQLAQAKAELEMLRNGPLREEIAQKEHEVERYKIELAYQENEVRRNQALLASSITSQEEVDQQLRQRDAAQKRLLEASEALARIKIGSRSEEIKAAEANLARLDAEVAYHTIQQGLTQLKAPINGRVITPHIEERVGQVAQEGELLCTIQDTTLQIEIEADEAAASQVKEGMPAEIRLWGLNGEPLTGKVSRVAIAATNGDAGQEFAVRSDREILAQRPYIPNQDSNYHVRVFVTPDALPEGVVPGMTGYAKVVIREERLWESVARPVVRFFRTEVWSWLP